MISHSAWCWNGEKGKCPSNKPKLLLKEHFLEWLTVWSKAMKWKNHFIQNETPSKGTPMSGRRGTQKPKHSGWQKIWSHLLDIRHYRGYWLYFELSPLTKLIQGWKVKKLASHHQLPLPLCKQCPWQLSVNPSQIFFSTLETIKSPWRFQSVQNKIISVPRVMVEREGYSERPVINLYGWQYTGRQANRSKCWAALLLITEKLSVWRGT